MQTRANILNNPEEALSLLSKWGINPKDAEISGASHYDQGFLHIRMKQGTLSYQLRYTLATPRNQSILRDQVKIVTKWKEKGIGVEEYISTSEGKLYLRDGNHLYVLIKNCPFPQITE